MGPLLSITTKEMTGSYYPRPTQVTQSACDVKSCSFQDDAKRRLVQLQVQDSVSGVTSGVALTKCNEVWRVKITIKTKLTESFRMKPNIIKSLHLGEAGHLSTNLSMLLRTWPFSPLSCHLQPHQLKASCQISNLLCRK